MNKVRNENGINFRRLSKAVSHALRHDPEAYGLKLDQEGWVSITALLDGLQSRSPFWAARLHLGHLISMVEGAQRSRHEIRLGKIRALYGHSASGKMELAASCPPDVLFHGTLRDRAAAIICDGLKPMSRHYVHLTDDREYAAHCRRGRLVVFTVLASAANMRGGIQFYRSGKSVWLANAVPPEFIMAESGYGRRVRQMFDEE
jgi:putative RNA 2'-phosphotransferase